MDYNIYIHYQEERPQTVPNPEPKPTTPQKPNDGDFLNLKADPAVVIGMAVASASLKALEEVGNYTALGGDYRLTNAVTSLKGVANAVFHPIQTAKLELETNIRNRILSDSNRLQAELLGDSILTERGI